MDRSQQQAQVSVEQALEAARALGGITQRVGQISDMSVQIASAVEQQSAVGEEIQRSLCGIREASDSNVAASSQSRISAEHVAGLASHLQLLVEQFRGRHLRTAKSLLTPVDGR